MSDYGVLGKKGSGKSLVTTARIRLFLLAGRRVATNLDLYLDRLLPPQSKATVIRLPDFPTGADLWAIGKGGDSPDEDQFGLIALDELAVFLNSRQWRDDKRQEVISYLRHTRKQRWHTYLLSQGLKSIDSQIRDELLDHTVILRRTDKLPIPILGKLLKMANFSGKFFRLHLGFVKYGIAHNSVEVDRWYVLGSKQLQSAYDTEQVFSNEPRYQVKTYPRYTATPCGFFSYSTYEQPAHLIGTFSYLSAWHLKGRYMSFWEKYRIHGFVVAGVLSLIFGLFTGHDVVTKTDLLKKPDPVVQPVVNNSPSQKLKGVIHNGFFGVLILSDGSLVYAENKTEYLDQYGNKRYKYLYKGDYYETSY